MGAGKSTDGFSLNSKSKLLKYMKGKSTKEAWDSLTLPKELPNAKFVPIGNGKDFYFGQLRGSSIEGNGLMIWAAGDLYFGEFKDGTMDGHGRYCETNGDVYDGEWKNGVREGRGTKIWSKFNERYTGEFHNNFR